MKPYEFMRFYHPKMRRFVYKHKGSGVIIDNIFKPLKSVTTSVFEESCEILKQKSIRMWYFAH